MSILETRVAKLEARIGPQIAPDERDPELVEFYRWWGGPGVPLEQIPCGVSAKPFIHGVMTKILANAQGTSLQIMP